MLCLDVLFGVKLKKSLEKIEDEKDQEMVKNVNFYGKNIVNESINSVKNF